MQEYYRAKYRRTELKAKMSITSSWKSVISGWKYKAAPDFGSGRGEQAKFHTWIPLKSCTAMASPKFRIEETFSNNVLITTFFKILKNLLTNLHKNLKILKIFQILNFMKYKKIC